MKSNDRPFRIGIALSLFPPVVGGAELLLLELAKRWVAAGHPTTVFTRVQPNAFTTETMDGIVVRREIRPLEFGPLFGPSFVWSLVRSIRQHAADFDVFMAFQAPWESAASGKVCARLGKPSIAALQQSGPFGDLANLRRSRAAGWLKKQFLNHQRFVGLSEHARKELVEIGCPREATRVIPNGIDWRKFAPPLDSATRDGPLTVLFVGRFVEQKNPLLLLEAWRRIESALPRRLVLVGAGPLETTAKEFAATHSLANVEFWGRRSDMPEVYRAADLFALPSRGEGCCMSLLEAMASALCPVVTAVGGNLDVVTSHVNGLTVPNEDPAALATALQALLEDEPRRRRLAQRAQADIQAHHDIDRAAANYLTLFAEVLGESHSRRPEARGA